jgi:hypothetical protein
MFNSSAREIDMTTANTILTQIGGNKFLAMTGAKNLLDLNGGLQFDLPRGAKNKASKVRIVLDDSDTYTVTFFKKQKWDFLPISSREDVYADMLRDVFTSETGLRCTL